MPATKPYFSTRSGVTYWLTDQADTVDDVFIRLLPDGFKYRVQVEGPYRAVIVCDGIGDETSQLQTILNHADVDEVVFDSGLTFTINGTLNANNKRLTILAGASLAGTGTIQNATLNYNWDDAAVGSGLTLTSCKTVTGLPVYTADATADGRGQILYYNSSTSKVRAKFGSTWKTVDGGETTMPLVIDGGGVTIVTGVQPGDFVVPYDFVVTGWTALADASGSIVVDIWQDTYANYPPTVADTITGSEKPTITTATKGQNLALSPTWTLTKGSTLRLNVDSVTTHKYVTINLHGYKS